jgi:hypothetical protein
MKTINVVIEEEKEEFQKPAGYTWINIIKIGIAEAKKAMKKQKGGNYAS